MSSFPICLLHNENGPMYVTELLVAYGALCCNQYELCNYERCQHQLLYYKKNAITEQANKWRMLSYVLRKQWRNILTNAKKIIPNLICNFNPEVTARVRLKLLIC